MEKLSEPQRVASVFAHPVRAMRDIGERPRYLIPILCVILFPLFSVILNMRYYHQQLLIQLQTMLQQQGISMDVNALAQTQMYAQLGLTPVITFVSWVLFALVVYLLAMPFEGEGEWGFKIAFSITGYAFLVKCILYVISGLLLYLNPGLTITFSLYDLVALAAGPIGNPMVAGVLQLFSLFRFWEYALVAVGIWSVKQVPKGKAVLSVILVFVVVLVVTCIQQVGAVAVTQGAM